MCLVAYRALEASILTLRAGCRGTDTIEVVGSPADGCEALGRGSQGRGIRGTEAVEVVGFAAAAGGSEAGGMRERESLDCRGRERELRSEIVRV